jgi:hypothetical protein
MTTTLLRRDHVTLLARIVAGLAAGWLTLATLYLVGARLLPRDAQGAAAIAFAAVSVLVGVVVFRLTRPMRPRPATPQELEQGFDVHLSGNYLAILVMLSLISFGIGGILLWLRTRRYPRRVDPRGMTLRDGRFLTWNELTESRAAPRQFLGVPLGQRWRLKFGDTEAIVSESALAEGPTVMHFLVRQAAEQVMKS